MEAKDLRIGNLVKRENQPDGFYIDSSSINLCEIHPDWYEPIQITEGWLIKLGFEKINHLFLKNDFLIELEITGDFQLVIEGVFQKMIIEVHQLQNLYFALTGEELIING